MRTTVFPLMLALVPAVAGAQQRIEITRRPAMVYARGDDDAPRAAIGVMTGGGASARDTLGLLVTAVTPDSPAEKAGIDEGNRLVAVNGQDLRLSAADVGDREMGGLMQRRLVRELGKVKPGDDVELKVWSGGQVRAVRVKTVASDSLYPERERLTMTDWRKQAEDRPALGIGLGASGTKRDTLGVFVSSVLDGGPAAAAGLEEGARISAINGVDLRVNRADAGDAEVAATKARRFQREVEKLKPGAEAELRVWQNGQSRTVKVKVGRAGDLPREAGFYFFGGDGDVPPMPPMAPMAPMPMMAPMPAMPPMFRMRVPMPMGFEMSDEESAAARRALEEARSAARERTRAVRRVRVVRPSA